MLQTADGEFLTVEDYAIKEKFNGVNLLFFEIPENQEIYNEDTIIETYDKQKYLVKTINGTSITCELDLDGLRAQQTDFNNDSATAGSTLSMALIGTGWTGVDNTGLSTRRTITGALTPLQVIEQIENTWDGVTAKFNNNTKVVTLILPANNAPTNTFVTEELNLRSLDIAGDSSYFCTRLRAKGADGLTFASINDGKDYVENYTYSNRVIYGTLLQDERFTDAQSLKDYAQAVLNAQAVPQIAYECDVVDIAAYDTAYNFLQLEMHKAVYLFDVKRNSRVCHRVVAYERHPEHPEKNKVTLSTVIQSVQNSVRALQASLNDPNSSFMQRTAAATNNATAWITGANGGYVIFKKNSDGQPEEILIMDTQNIETAQKVWRWNKNGLGYSSNGYNGDYSLAMTADGAIVADFITSGTLSADRIQSGMISSDDGRVVFDLNNSLLTAQNGNDRVTLRGLSGALLVQRRDDANSEWQEVGSIYVNTGGKSCASLDKFSIGSYGNEIGNIYHTNGDNPRSIVSVDSFDIGFSNKVGTIFRSNNDNDKNVHIDNTAGGTINTNAIINAPGFRIVDNNGNQIGCLYIGGGVTSVPRSVLTVNSIFLDSITLDNSFVFKSTYTDSDGHIINYLGWI